MSEIPKFEFSMEALELDISKAKLRRKHRTIRDKINSWDPQVVDCVKKCLEHQITAFDIYNIVKKYFPELQLPLIGTFRLYLKEFKQIHEIDNEGLY